VIASVTLPAINPGPRASRRRPRSRPRATRGGSSLGTLAFQPPDPTACNNARRRHPGRNQRVHRAQQFLTQSRTQDTTAGGGAIPSRPAAVARLPAVSRDLRRGGSGDASPPSKQTTSRGARCRCSTPMWWSRPSSELVTGSTGAPTAGHDGARPSGSSRPRWRSRRCTSSPYEFPGLRGSGLRQAAASRLVCRETGGDAGEYGASVWHFEQGFIVEVQGYTKPRRRSERGARRRAPAESSTWFAGSFRGKGSPPIGR